MLHSERPPVSRVRGAACNGVDHAGESPVAAIARFGCVAMSDTHNRRLLRVQAQIKVLGTRSGPTRQEGERNLGPQRRANTAASTRLATRNGSWPNEQPSPFPHGRRPMDADEGNGSVQSVSAPAHGWWHQGNGQRPKAGKVSASRGPSHKLRARRWVMARLADRVVVAMMPMDNITSAEQRTRGAALCAMTRRRTRHGWPVVSTTGDPRRVAKSRAKGAPNSGQVVPGQGASEGIVRSRCLEAVLGKTRRTEF
jgi:hypothetical protein